METESEETSSIIQEPEDWSEELAEIELNLHRLEWSKQDENKYLKKLLNISDRSRIIRYEDLNNYLLA